MHVRSRSVGRNTVSTLPRLSIVIPIYNEAELIATVLEHVRAIDYDNLQLVLVDDCSTDGTAEILQQEAAKPNTIVLRHDKNRGKGAAIVTGIAQATGDIIIIQDADMEYDPNDIPAVVMPIVRGEVDVCYGSRFRGKIVGMRFPNRVGNILLAWAATLLFGQRITDEATAYKAFRRHVLEEITLRAQRFDFCPEVTAKVLRKGHRIKEVPVSYRARTFEEGKKVRWTDFFHAMGVLIKVRFMRQDQL